MDSRRPGGRARAFFVLAVPAPWGEPLEPGDARPRLDPVLRVPALRAWVGARTGAVWGATPTLERRLRLLVDVYRSLGWPGGLDDRDRAPGDGAQPWEAQRVAEGLAHGTRGRVVRRPPLPRSGRGRPPRRCSTS